MRKGKKIKEYEGEKGGKGGTTGQVQHLSEVGVTMRSSTENKAVG